VTLHSDWLSRPLHWRKARTVFVCSMGDLFHDSIPFSYIASVWNIMETARKHTFLVLTKRPRRMHEFLTTSYGRFAVRGYMAELPNCWCGVTAENQAIADERIPLLLRTPAAVRFVSIEPMLGPISFYKTYLLPMDDGALIQATAMQGIDWVICGGESGPGARPMKPDWVRSIRDQCFAFDIPFFFKQWGEWSPVWDGVDTFAGYDTMMKVGKRHAGHLLDGVEHHEWPHVTSPGSA